MGYSVVSADSSSTSNSAKQNIPDLEENPLDWALKSLDEKLNEVEANPHPIHKAIYGISRGPVGEAANQGVQIAGKAAVNVTVEAAKVAAPVGKWAVQQGFKAAMGLVSRALDWRDELNKVQEESKRQKQKAVKDSVKRTGGAGNRNKRP